MERTIWRWLLLAFALGALGHAVSPVQAREAYFGDLHVHTLYSFDAFIFGVRTDPDDAYRYARGEPLPHPNGATIRLRGAPLDFMAVTDHSEYLGMIPRIAHPEHPLAATDLAKLLNSKDFAEVLRGHGRVTRAIITGEDEAGLDDRAVVAATWQRIIEAAERHYRPGTFTTFVGFEFTPHPGANLHRNVIFRSAEVPDEPFGALDSLNPEDLWTWLDDLRERGIEAMAIPHNANWSNGTMFPQVTFEGDPIDRTYAAQRARNEPLVEITQVKGTSETHPLLSPNDEWAGFELFGDKPGDVGGVAAEDIRLDGSYARQALMTGLVLQEQKGFNPYQFGFIGSSDTHNTGASYDESRYEGKLGSRDGTPERRLSVPPAGIESWAEFERASSSPGAPYVINWSAAGLAGVWADENTREALYDAMRRRETFGTSGTRIRVRLFAGYDVAGDVLQRHDGLDELYRSATPMGSELMGRSEGSPTFVAWAMRDPASAWLQRLQIVKAWVADGAALDRVYDVSCADGATPDSQTHRCPDSAARVNLDDCSVPAEHGAVELKAAWQDPHFDPAQRALYYLRVLENPTCRWSTWDAVRAGIEPNPAVPATIQERAWTSPIWYAPQS